MDQETKAIPSRNGSEEARQRRLDLDELLSGTFNSILRVEEQSLQNRITDGLTITEVHTIVAVGYRESNPMNVVASRLDVTLATLNSAVNKLAKKGYVKRERSSSDKRKMLVSLTVEGRKVYRAHRLFHKEMVEEALAELTEEEECVLARALGKVKRFFDQSVQ